ncbi:hypothetical protein [Bradyrhizobium sp. NP1]|uniref:hypothetical protein n=1 Tax=Bradyrhizobium sp. NP1 TaxID=3049772 RepID=UPI0025A52337|nr:hypothetical protein [Bradyrhizobium sp. NP1]WJR81322.1 hypothetical protein QOU61_16690 [Bradyrhizobium sp. NP1]
MVRGGCSRHLVRQVEQSVGASLHLLLSRFNFGRLDCLITFVFVPLGLTNPITQLLLEALFPAFRLGAHLVQKERQSAGHSDEPWETSATPGARGDLRPLVALAARGSAAKERSFAASVGAGSAARAGERQAERLSRANDLRDGFRDAARDPNEDRHVAELDCELGNCRILISPLRFALLPGSASSVCEGNYRDGHYCRMSGQLRSSTFARLAFKNG